MDVRNLTLTAFALLPVQASALCFHDGKLYAQTTLAQEFRESRWVVRARVESAQGPNGWTVYRLKLLRSYKGTLPQHFKYFTMRDSGSFPLDRGPVPDIGGEYLLFLTVPDTGNERIPAAWRATGINYSCGQSKPWRDVSPSERNELLLMRAEPSGS
jgi:hypothetical protein